MYLVNPDRMSRKIESAMPIIISEAELSEIILTATGHHLKTRSRFADKSFSILYEVSVAEDADIHYVVQVRHYEIVTSMSFLMTLISSTMDPCIIPLPTIYPIFQAKSSDKRRLA